MEKIGFFVQVILFVEPAYIEIDEGIFQGHLAFAGFGEAVYKIEDKDKKILYELDRNSRQSNKQIAKKGGLSEQVVGNRIRRLQEWGIIEYFILKDDKR